MRPKRNAARPHQLQSQPILSDYDTEDPNTMTDNPAALPTSLPPNRTNTELNLAVLRRYCPDISHIITIAPFSVVYIFSPESQTWEKCGIEGTLFVNKLSTPNGAPRYNIVILNRKSMDNFMTDLTSADDIDITEEYVILQAKGGEEQTMQIYGLWIFSEVVEQGMSTREIVGSAVQGCAAQVQAYHEGLFDNGHEQRQTSELDDEGYQQNGCDVETPEVARQSSGTPLDLLQLFGKAPPQAMHQASMHGHQPQSTGAHSKPAGQIIAPGVFPNMPSSGAFQPSQGQQNMLLDLFKSAR